MINSIFLRKFFSDLIYIIHSFPPLQMLDLLQQVSHLCLTCTVWMWRQQTEPHAGSRFERFILNVLLPALF